MILIKLLKEDQLQEAGKLANAVFPEAEVPPIVGLEASLDEKVVKKLNSEHGGQFNWLKYWVAIDDNTNRVVGVTGIYEKREDAKASCWLGWYCVDPEFRGQGIGTMLLDFAINEANKLKKRYLRLYTSTDPNDAVAQIVYEKKGFKIMEDRPRKSDGTYETFCRELDLVNQKKS